jgi:hypothetical protein
MSVMLVGAIVALIVVVMALGGSQIARRWAIGMYGLLVRCLTPADAPLIDAEILFRQPGPAH